MNIGEADKHLRQQLQSIYEEGECKAISLLIVEDCTDLAPAVIRLNPDKELTGEAEERLQRHLQRLMKHEPVQYITTKTWFYGMELYVDSNVLIPRPETEELVNWVIKDMKASGKDVFEKSATDADETTKLKILDIGTGSGWIALALKNTIPKAEVWGCDVSEEALNVARRNGAALNIRVDFQGLDFLDEAQQKLLPTVDVIVSNPPYIPLGEKDGMNANVVQYEPHSALFVPDEKALIFYEAIAQFAHKRLYEGGSIYLEVHENLSKEVAGLFVQKGYSVEVKKDMQEKDRMVKAISGMSNSLR